MPRSLPTYLADIQLSIGAIEEFTNGRTLEQFEQDRMLRSAVRGELMIVGEAVTNFYGGFQRQKPGSEPPAGLLTFAIS